MIKSTKLATLITFVAMGLFLCSCAEKSPPPPNPAPPPVEDDGKKDEGKKNGQQKGQDAKATVANSDMDKLVKAAKEKGGDPQGVEAVKKELLDAGADPKEVDKVINELKVELKAQGGAQQGQGKEGAADKAAVAADDKAPAAGAAVAVAAAAAGAAVAGGGGVCTPTP